MGRPPVIAAVSLVLYRALLLLCWPRIRRTDRARMVGAFREGAFRGGWRDAGHVGGVGACPQLWRSMLDEMAAHTREEHAWAQQEQQEQQEQQAWQAQQARQAQQRKDTYVNIHDPKVQKESGTAFRRSLQALLCIVLMHLSTLAMVEAGHTGSIILEATMTAVAAASIIACFVAMALELWAMGKVGKALLASRG